CRLHSTISPIFRLLSSSRVTMTRDGRILPFILLIRDAPSVLVALCKRTSLCIITVVSSTRLLRSCLTLPTNAPSAKYPSSPSSLTYYAKSVLTPPTTVVVVFESEGQSPQSLAGLTDYEIKLLG
ncbi:unnamed protein product, partial [Porites lobata]